MRLGCGDGRSRALNVQLTASRLGLRRYAAGTRDRGPGVRCWAAQRERVVNGVSIHHPFAFFLVVEVRGFDLSSEDGIDGHRICQDEGHAEEGDAEHGGQRGFRGRCVECGEGVIRIDV